MLSGANAFEISDIERMTIGAHQPGDWHVTMLHALWLHETTIRQGQVPEIWTALLYPAAYESSPCRRT